MSLPKHVFLDTSVLAGQGYNFGSAILSSFTEAAKERGLNLVLPAPTESEIVRQIRSRSDEALKALDEARRKAPFLKKWKHWPPSPTDRNPEWEVRRIAIAEWRGFLAQFNLTKLDYRDIDLQRVMGWYDSIQAPFREGKKRKEFPDAFAIESLAQYANKHHIYIAVVSEDLDFKAACEHFTSLLYFPSLAKLIEKLLAQDTDLDPLRESLIGNRDSLMDAIMDEVDDLGFYPDDSDIELDDSEVEGIELRDLRIVGLGDLECTVAFDFIMKSKHELSWSEWGGSDGDVLLKEHDSMRQSDVVSGTAKIQLGKDGLLPATVSFIELDEDEIEIAASRSPYWHKSYY